MTSLTDSKPTQVCDECGQPIVGGYWSTFFKGERKDYHPRCKPTYYFMHGLEVAKHPKADHVDKAVT